MFQTIQPLKFHEMNWKALDGRDQRDIIKNEGFE
jgi:hypothetical protein